jgi:serine/threonine protein kinase/Tol biopolymer transport system component
MQFSAGTRLGPYEILAPIGAGGMGEVYKSRDTRLDRIVAIKTSKTEFSQRFEREAKAVAALNHANICQLYDVGPDYLVMEYIEGTPLKGPLSVDQALKYAAQICDALDAAHKKGIAHRDLKPANILVTKAGIKLLDFGLAKLASPGGEQAVQPLNDATLTMALTGRNEIVGTLYYMSPEQLQAQATGKEVDGRSDIFSFGIVLYEMLTGVRAFEGSSPASVIAAIMERPAPSVAEVAPPALDYVLKRCLEKDAENRWQTASDLKAALLLAAVPVVQAAPPAPAKRRSAWIVATAVAATTIIAAAAWAWWRPAPEPVPPIQFSLDAPPDTEFRSLYFSSAVSPDGRFLVFAAQKKGDATTPTLWLREMNSLTSRELPGTEDGNGPFWSPDSKSIGFQADGKLKRIDLAGGSVQNLCDATEVGFEGGSWNQDGVILFGSAAGGLTRVSSAGGAPVPVTSPDREKESSVSGAISHRYPHFLPDGRNFLYTQLGALDRSGIYVASLDRPNQSVRLLQSDAKAVYVPPRNGLNGYLLWLRDQTLVAQRFDPKSRKLDGEPLVVADGIASGFAANGRRAAYSVSATGVLAYRGGGNAGFDLSWVNRDGKPEATASSASFQRGGDPSISPDGRRIAMERQTGSSMQVWLYETDRGIMTRLSLDAGFSWFPVWSPDGKQVAYSANRNGSWGIYRKDAGGGGKEEQLLSGSDAGAQPSSWSRDGRYLLYQSGDRQVYGNMVKQVGIFLLPLTGTPQERKPVPFLQTPFREANAQFSPDGKWVAYESDESGHQEVYVQPFPSTGAKWQVSNKGGVQPRWRGDGRELFFISETTQRLWAAGIQASAGHVEIATPRPLFPILLFPGPSFLYDVTRDGQHFVVISPPGAGAQGTSAIDIVSDWQSGLKK